MKNIFLDTSIYRKYNFDFEGKKLKELLDLISSNRIQLYSTLITHNEIISNIDDEIDATREFVNDLLKHGYILRNTSPFKSFFEEKKAANKASDEIKEKYNDYRKKANIKEVPINIANIDGIFKSYFKELPPFSAKKKDEIPDAVVLSALEEWFQEHSNTCYIISTDKDMKNYCEGNKKLIYLESIDKLMAIITDEDDEEKYKRIIELFETIQDTVLQSVQENIYNQPFVLLADGEVDEVALHDVKVVSGPLVTETGVNFARVSFEVSFEYDVHYSILDITSSPYDSETRGYLWKEYSSETTNGSQELTVEVLLTNINFEQINYEDVEIGETDLDNNGPILVKTWYD